MLGEFSLASAFTPASAMTTCVGFAGMLVLCSLAASNGRPVQERVIRTNDFHLRYLSHLEGVVAAVRNVAVDEPRQFGNVNQTIAVGVGRAYGVQHDVAEDSMTFIAFESRRCPGRRPKRC